MDRAPTNNEVSGVGERRSHGRARLRVLLRTRMLLGMAGDAPRLPERLYCVALPVALTAKILLALDEAQVSHLPYIATILEYNANVLASLIVTEGHLLPFCSGIERTDLEMGLDLPLATPAAVYMFFAVSVYRFSITLPYFILYGLKDGWYIYSMALMLFANNISHIPRILPLDLLRIRINILRKGLERSFKQHSWNGNNMNNSINFIDRSIETYSKLINNLDSNFSCAKPMICVSFSCCFIQILIGGGSVWNRYDINRLFEVNFLVLVQILLELLVTASLVCSPAIFGELVSREVEMLELTIGNQLLIYSDGALGAALARAADYLRRRPCRLSVARAFNLDAALILTFASVCTTYTIVILQYLNVI